jgi:hypothetical protein
MALRGFRQPFTTSENILGFPRPPAPGPGTQALDLVYQAADLGRGLAARAGGRAPRAEAAEQAQLEIINATERKLRDAARALEEARRRIESQQEQLEALEFRAQVAEAEARESRQSLALVEDAIRRRLLLTADQLDNSGSAVA